MEIKRGLGRPKEIYMDNIKEWTGRNSKEIYTMTKSRDE